MWCQTLPQQTIQAPLRELTMVCSIECLEWMEKCYTAQVKYTPPTVCDDLMAQIGEHVELLRHNRALAAHKKKYKEALKWIAIDDVDDEYDTYLINYDDGVGGWVSKADNDELLSSDELDADYSNIICSWVWHTMDVRANNGLIPINNYQCCSPQFKYA